VVEVLQAPVQERVAQEERQEGGDRVTDPVGLHAALRAPPGEAPVQAEEEQRRRQGLLPEVEVELHEHREQQHDVEEGAEGREPEDALRHRRQLEELDDEGGEDDHRDGDRALHADETDRTLLQILEHPPPPVLDHAQGHASQDGAVVGAVVLVEGGLEAE
jgi:hypothetical protein